MRTKNLTHIVLITALIAFGGCGDDATGPSTPVEMTGTWTSNGRFSDGFTFVMIMTLSQTDATVTGTAQVLNIMSGAITGTVSGNRFTFQFTLPPQCPGTLNGVATISGRSITGTLDGPTPCFGTTHATYEGVKQLQ